MHGADNHGESSSSASAFLDPRLAALATFAVALLPYGAWRAFTRPQQQTPHDNTHQVTALDSQHAPHDNTKQKRSKERRRRSAVPKLKTGGGLGQHQQKKHVVRQPSAVAGGRKLRATSPAADDPDELLQDTQNNMTPRPASVSRFDLPQRGRSSRPINISGDAHYGSLTSRLCPQDIPLPLSPVLAPNNTLQSPSPSLSASSSPIRRPISPLLPSPSVGTIASTSGTPLTPPSLTNSQVLPMAPFHALYSQDNWEWPTRSGILAGPASLNPSPNTRNSSLIARKCAHSTKGFVSPARAFPQADDRSKLQVPAQELTFPTLNALPPPSTPLEDQIDILRSSIEASRGREQAARQGEEALTLELEQSRIEVEQARQEVNRLQWQLNEMSQREERLQSQIHALTMQLQTIHHGRPPPLPLAVPMVFQPQPMPYPTSHFYQSPHPFAPPSPMVASQMLPPAPFPITQMPMSHPHLSPVIMPVHAGRSQSTPGPATPLESFQPPHPHYHRHSPALHHPQAQRHHARGPSEIELRAGLLEAIMKHPNSLSMGNNRHGEGESVESGRASIEYSRSASISLSGSGGSMNVSRSGSATGSQSDDVDDAHVNVHLHINDLVLIEGSGEETPGTGGACGADAGGMTHSQSESSTDEEQQSSEPLDQVTGRSEENAVPIYY